MTVSNELKTNAHDTYCSSVISTVRGMRLDGRLLCIAMFAVAFGLKQPSCFKPIDGLDPINLSVKLASGEYAQFSIDLCGTSYLIYQGETYQTNETAYAFTKDILFFAQTLVTPCNIHRTSIHVEMTYDPSETIQGTVRAKETLQIDPCDVITEYFYSFSWSTSLNIFPNLSQPLLPVIQQSFKPFSGVGKTIISFSAERVSRVILLRNDTSLMFAINNWRLWQGHYRTADLFAFSISKSDFSNDHLWICIRFQYNRNAYVDGYMVSSQVYTTVSKPDIHHYDLLFQTSNSHFIPSAIWPSCLTYDRHPLFISLSNRSVLFSIEQYFNENREPSSVSQATCPYGNEIQQESCCNTEFFTKIPELTVAFTNQAADSYDLFLNNLRTIAHSFHQRSKGVSSEYKAYFETIFKIFEVIIAPFESIASDKDAFELHMDLLHNYVLGSLCQICVPTTTMYSEPAADQKISLFYSNSTISSIFRSPILNSIKHERRGLAETLATLLQKAFETDPNMGLVDFSIESEYLSAFRNLDMSRDFTTDFAGLNVMLPLHSILRNHLSLIIQTLSNHPILTDFPMDLLTNDSVLTPPYLQTSLGAQPERPEAVTPFPLWEVVQLSPFFRKRKSNFLIYAVLFGIAFVLFLFLIILLLCRRKSSSSKREFDHEYEVINLVV